MIVHLTADIYANDDTGSYRIYIDDTLMAERTFAWNHREQCIQECMVINTEPNTTHTVRVEPCKTHTKFKINSVTVNGNEAKSTFTL